MSSANAELTTVATTINMAPTPFAIVIILLLPTTADPFKRETSDHRSDCKPYDEDHCHGRIVEDIAE